MLRLKLSKKKKNRTNSPNTSPNFMSYLLYNKRSSTYNARLKRKTYNWNLYLENKWYIIKEIVQRQIKLNIYCSLCERANLFDSISLALWTMSSMFLDRWCEWSSISLRTISSCSWKAADRCRSRCNSAVNSRIFTSFPSWKKYQQH